VRDTKNGAILTFKGPATAVKYKSREELEVAVDQGGLLKTILARLGFQPAFCYQKYRAEFRRDAGGIAMLDETPIGVFLELEGAPRWIDRTARLLGFSEADYLTASYWGLYVDWCAQNRRQPSHMLFTRSRR
jgi:adenylate cyclase class 2